MANQSIGDKGGADALATYRKLDARMSALTASGFNPLTVDDKALRPDIKARGLGSGSGLSSELDSAMPDPPPAEPPPGAASLPSAFKMGSKDVLSRISGIFKGA